jgi:hypothetical protein
MGLKEVGKADMHWIAAGEVSMTGFHKYLFSVAVSGVSTTVKRTMESFLTHYIMCTDPIGRAV